MYPVWQKEQQPKYNDTFHTDWDIFSIETFPGTGLDSPYKLSKIDIHDVLPWLYRQVDLNSQNTAPKLSKLHQSTVAEANHAQYGINTGPNSKERVTLLYMESFLFETRLTTLVSRDTETT
jgi:hypothetical protein